MKLHSLEVEFGWQDGVTFFECRKQFTFYLVLLYYFAHVHSPSALTLIFIFYENITVCSSLSVSGDDWRMGGKRAEFCLPHPACFFDRPHWRRELRTYYKNSHAMPLVTSVKELDIPTKKKLDMDYLGNNALTGTVITLHSLLCLNRLVKTMINLRFPRPKAIQFRFVCAGVHWTF